MLFVSATQIRMKMSMDYSVQSRFRPTGLLDEVVVRPVEGQIDDHDREVNKETASIRF